MARSTVPKSRFNSMDYKHQINFSIAREQRKHNQISITWCKDLSVCLLFFLADEVTLLLSLNTIKVSSSSAKKGHASYRQAERNNKHGKEIIFYESQLLPTYRKYTFHGLITSRWTSVKKVISNILHCALQPATRDTMKSKILLESRYLHQWILIFLLLKDPPTKKKKRRFSLILCAITFIIFSPIPWAINSDITTNGFFHRDSN